MHSPGDELGPYVVESVLGAGGMGCVYIALDPRLGRRVALKVLPSAEGPKHAESAARMMREARAAAAFSHPNAVAVYDVGEASGSPYIAMELVVGKPLRAYCGDPSIPWARRLRWLVDVARALGAAHRTGIIHRDVKPDNVIVAESGVAKILDFGIARRPTGEVDASAPTGHAALPTLTAEGTTIGTTAYMAPEQIRNESLDGRTDQFSWAVTACEVLTGRLPWSGSDGLQIVAQILSAEPRRSREALPDLPAEVEEHLSKALSKDRSERFASMEEVADALEPYASETGARGRTAGPTPSGRKPAPTPAPGRRATGRGIALALAVMLVAAGGATIGTRFLRKAPTAAGASDPSAALTIVVVPLDNLSRRAEDDWLSVGLAEAIRTKLGALEGVTVTIRRPGAPDAGAEPAPGSALVVSGAYQRVGDEIRISVRAERADRPGAALASVEERGTVSTLFDLQDTIALGLAGKIRGTLSPATEAAVRKSGTRNLDAFEAYAKGLALVGSGHVVDAMRQLDRAVALDPSFVPAQAAQRRWRAETQHVLFRPDGTVVETVYAPNASSQAGPKRIWSLTTNIGALTRAWDLAGNALELTKEKRLGDETEYHITLPPLRASGGGSTEQDGIVYERELLGSVRSNDGISVVQARMTNDKAADQTFLLELPPGVELLAVLPLPIESSTDESGTFVLLRQFREPYEPFHYDVLYASDRAHADRFRAFPVAEREQKLRAPGSMRFAASAAVVAAAAESIGACLAARRGKAAEAQAQLATIERARSSYGVFYAGFANACVAAASGDDAATFREIETALSAKERVAEVYADAVLLLIGAAERLGRLADAERIVRRELERLSYWQKGSFHGLAGADAEPKLAELHARDPDNDAVRLDLAALRLQAGRADDAWSLVEDRERTSAKPYVCALKARIALARNQPAEAVATLRRLATLLPSRFGFVSQAITLAEAGKAPLALDLLVNHARKDDALDVPTYRGLFQIVRRLDAPLARKDDIVGLVRDAREIDYGGAFRLELFVDLLKSAAENPSPSRFEFLNATFDAFKTEVGRQTACDKACLAALTSTACELEGLTPAQRTWLRSNGATPCRDR